MKRLITKPYQVSHSLLLVLVTAFLICFANLAFFSNVLRDYPLSLHNLLFLVSLSWVFGGLTLILLSLVSYRRTIKPVLITILMVSSVTAYFMDSYNTIFNTSMIENVLQTNMNESMDLLSFKLLIYILLLGVLPSWLIYKARLNQGTLRQEILSRAKLLLLTFVSVVAVLLMFSDFYSSFFREHKPLRYYSNPGYYLFSLGQYIAQHAGSNQHALQAMGLDAHIPAQDHRRELVIFVVGETARADHFSLNGYERETNPLLKKEQLVSFRNFWSCATSTALSVPCMFSSLKAEEYDEQQAHDTENVLDILRHASVNLLWLDNNSNSKGVADRIEYHSLRTANENPVCDVECRDEGMLVNLQQYINSHRQGDIFIVLHQMGNHGPAYYKRYPAGFEKFTPACHTNQLEACSIDSIKNSYDNAILYTDYFLSRVIALLKDNDEQFETAMMYVSDHGESLGEHGLYLHGLPNFIAPDAQRHVAAILWSGKNNHDIDIDMIDLARDTPLSHDNVFHTILGLMEIDIAQHDKSLDILHIKPGNKL